MLPPELQAIARRYYKDPPRFAVGVDEPWWYAVLALGADRLNGQFPMHFAGPLAIVARRQRLDHYHTDCEAVRQILKAEEKATFDAYRCPKGRNGKIVGIVEAVGWEDDSLASSAWWSGPTALRVTDPIMLPEHALVALDVPEPGALDVLPKDKRDALLYSISAAVNHRG
jgi:hypothetical protein